MEKLIINENIIKKFMEISENLIKENNYDRSSGSNIEKINDLVNSRFIFERKFMFGKGNKIDKYVVSIITDININILSYNCEKLEE